MLGVCFLMTFQSQVLASKMAKVTVLVTLTLATDLIFYNNNNNKYISKALNPSVRNLHEAQSAAHVYLNLSKLPIQLKPSKQRNQQCQNSSLFYL